MPTEVPVRLLAVLLALTLAGGAGALASGRDAAPAPRVAAPAPIEEEVPMPRPRPRLVEPEAGVAVTAEEEPTDVKLVRRSKTRPMPAPAAVSSDPDRATALPNGVALPPLAAPEPVMEVIRAGNSIARTPYKWGGGHGRFLDSGYDCSGSVSFALYSAGLIEGSRTSGGLMSWGKPGRGRWITIYANDGHVFMEAAGIRFDTSGARRTGSRWQNARRPTAGYVARHPPGL